MREDTRSENQLLAALHATDFARLARPGQSVELEHGKVLYEAETEIDAVWFPETGLISIMSVMLSGEMIETSVVGREGGFGFIEAVGAGVTFSRAVVQVPGRFRKVPAADYRAAFDSSPTLRKTINEHIELLITEARQAMGCLALHPVDQRLAWWLLEAQDRIGGEAQLPFTHEFLAVMLGIQRTTVSVHAGKLQDLGLIRYRRGHITVLDRDGLERYACECYATGRHFRQRIERT